MQTLAIRRAPAGNGADIVERFGAGGGPRVPQPPATISVSGARVGKGLAIICTPAELATGPAFRALPEGDRRAAYLPSRSLENRNRPGRSSS